MNLDFETILFFFQTYKRWPNEIEKHYIEQMLNSPYNSVSQIYEPLFDKIKYKKMILNSAQVYEITNLLIDFYNQNKRFPYADEEYKGYNLYNFMYALKFYKLPISTSNKAILNKLHFFRGKNIHISVLNLINYFYIIINGQTKKLYSMILKLVILQKNSKRFFQSFYWRLQNFIRPWLF